MVADKATPAATQPTGVARAPTATAMVIAPAAIPKTFFSNFSDFKFNISPFKPLAWQPTWLRQTLYRQKGVFLMAAIFCL